MLEIADDIPESAVNGHMPPEVPRNVLLLKCTDQVKELQTILRDKRTNRSDFVFYADRLIRLIVEDGLSHLPYTQCTVTTPTGETYEGLQYEKGNCGVSIMRSGEAMEKGLRDCCRSIRIGKILIQTDEDTHEAKVFYAKFPHDIHKRKVLLMYPIMSSGNTIIRAVEVLREHGVEDKNIIVLNLFTTPAALKSVHNRYQDMKLLTSEIHETAPVDFGHRYFGTE